MSVQPDLRRAVQLHQQNRPGEAESVCRAILAAQPRHFEALTFLAMLKVERGEPGEALPLVAAAVEAEPKSAAAHSHHGIVLAALGRHDEALAAFGRALAIDPRFADALCNRGDLLFGLGRHAEALTSFEAALAARPRLHPALVGRGLALRALKRPAEAVLNLEKAVAAVPNDPETLNNLAVALRDLGRHEEALAQLDRAVALRPDFAEAHCNRGHALRRLRRPAEALVSYGRALGLRPDSADFHNSRGNAFAELHRAEEALASYERALALDPDHADALLNLANLLLKLRRYGEAEAAYLKLRAAVPDHPYVRNGLVFCQLSTCDWADADRMSRELLAHAEERKWTVEPGMLHALDNTPAEQNRFAEIWVRTEVGSPPQPFKHSRSLKDGKLRIAYVSAEFRRHPVSEQMVGLFERHDRSRFEVHGISIGPDDKSDMRARLTKAFDRFHDATTRTDESVAKLFHEAGVNIAVDVSGYLESSRPRIFAMRPAPIQVSYLGFPGPMGSPHIDYVVADAIVAPSEHQSSYTERIVHLPDCYLVSDSKKPRPSRAFTRGECGLPERGFVFCCFNNVYKLSARTFEVWMRLLHAVEGSVLWLSQVNPVAADNLRKAATAHGIAPERIIFAPRLASLEDHLARHRVADLFLDTLPYNAHTTANDALWAGLPVLTCLGPTFVGRVGASQLRAVGLPELVTTSFADYEALAVALASDPSRLAAIRRKLADNLATCPLFDTDRFRRHMEAAFTTMWEIWQRGEPPRGFAVPPLP